MTDLIPVLLTAAVIAGLIAFQVFRHDFDPFAPLWLFLAGYTQIYVVQAISYRAYGLSVRGEEIVLAGNIRALWALLLFLAVYYCGVSKKIAAKLPKAPASWSVATIVMITPFMVVWGVICSIMSVRIGTVGAEDSLLTQFPMMLLIAGVMLLVTGRQPDKPRPIFTAAGAMICIGYCIIWMFNSKRSHSIFAVLCGVSAYYIPRLRRPGVPTMAATGFACALVVSVALGWRGNTMHEQSLGGFIEYLSEFRLDSILVNLNLKERDEERKGFGEVSSKETEEIGGYWLMLDTVPDKSPYDYGGCYNRIWSTFIPRAIWQDKPLYGRAEWVGAWVAGSKQARDQYFTGPAIGLLGAAQLNGGWIATAILMSTLALLLRTGYDYYRFYATSPWAQAWWCMTYFNAWLMNANDDPFVWFYYIYGFTTLPVMAGLWIFNRLVTQPEASTFA